MVRIQGMVRDTTPALVTGLGHAGKAVGGAVDMNGKLLDQAAQVQDMALKQEENERRNAAVGMSIEQIKLGMEERQYEMDQRKKRTADGAAANELQIQSLMKTHEWEALGQDAQDFIVNSARIAATLDPVEGDKLVRASTTIVQTAKNDLDRKRVGKRVSESIATGYWREAVAELQGFSGGIDIDKDGKPDVAFEQLDKYAENLLKRLEEPGVNAKELEDEYDDLRNGIEYQRALVGRRVSVFNAYQQDYDMRRNYVRRPMGAPDQGGYQDLPDLTADQYAEMNRLLTDYRLGDLGDGPGAERELRMRFEALNRGKKFIPLPENSPLFGSTGGLEVDYRTWEEMDPRQRERFMGYATGKEAEVMGASLAVDAFGKLVANRRADPRAAMQMLPQLTEFFTSLIRGDLGRKKDDGSMADMFSALFSAGGGPVASGGGAGAGSGTVKMAASFTDWFGNLKQADLADLRAKMGSFPGLVPSANAREMALQMAPLLKEFGLDIEEVGDFDDNAAKKFLIDVGGFPATYFTEKPKPKRKIEDLSTNPNR